MLGAVIRNGNNTLVVELPTGTMDLQTKLSSIHLSIVENRCSAYDFFNFERLFWYYDGSLILILHKITRQPPLSPHF